MHVFKLDKQDTVSGVLKSAVRIDDFSSGVVGPDEPTDLRILPDQSGWVDGWPATEPVLWARAMREPFPVFLPTKPTVFPGQRPNNRIDQKLH